MSSVLYLVIDMINDLIDIDGPGGQSPLALEAARRDIVARTRGAIEQVRATGGRVAFVRVGYSDDYRELPLNSPAFAGFRTRGTAKLGTWGTEPHAGLGRQPEDFLIAKHRISAFYGTELELVLRSHGITKLYISGITTVAGVQSAARDAHDRDYEVFVVEDCCASQDQKEHDASIAMLSRFCRIVTSESLISGGPS